MVICDSDRVESDLNENAALGEQSTRIHCEVQHQRLEFLAIDRVLLRHLARLFSGRKCYGNND